MKGLRIALATALLMTGHVASAQTANDAQCIVVSNAFASQTKDANQQKAAEAVLYFYLGRIGSQLTSAQLKALLDKQSATITEANAGTTMNKCFAALQAKIQLLQGLAQPAQPAKPAKPQGR
jgi:hypothetical protein